jgi:hypothetical protein
MNGSTNPFLYLVVPVRLHWNPKDNQSFIVEYSCHPRESGDPFFLSVIILFGEKK